jgi:hypothetical protein
MTVPTGLPVGATGVADRATGYELKPNSDGSLSTTPATGANQRVNAQSGDFVAGSIVDLATLLTLAQINTGTPTETAVSVAASTTDVLAANANRKMLLLINDSTNTIYVKFSGDASLNTGTRLNANGGSILFDRYVPTSAVKAIATVAGSTLLVTEG